MSRRALTMTPLRLGVLRAIAAGNATSWSTLIQTRIGSPSTLTRTQQLLTRAGLISYVGVRLTLTAQGEHLLALPDSVILGVTQAYGPPGDGDRATWAWDTVRALWGGQGPVLRPMPRATAATSQSRLDALRRLVDDARLDGAR